MSEPRVLLDCAAFLDSENASSCKSVKRSEMREVLQRFLAACYEDLGMAPRLVDGEAMARLLQEILPRRFAVRDPLADLVEEVLAAYLPFLAQSEIVPSSFEQLRALDEHGPPFRQAVATGEAHREGLAIPGPGTTIAHRAAKTGRNDLCPCGSGKKFKKCCMRLGGTP